MYPTHRGMGGVPPSTNAGGRLNDLLEQIRTEFEGQLRAAENFEHQSKTDTPVATHSSLQRQTFLQRQRRAFSSSTWYKTIFFLHYILANESPQSKLRCKKCSSCERKYIPWSRLTCSSNTSKIRSYFQHFRYTPLLLCVSFSANPVPPTHQV